MDKKQSDFDGEVNVGTPMLKDRVTPSPVPTKQSKVEEPALELEDDYDDEDFDSHVTPAASRGSAMNIIEPE